LNRQTVLRRFRWPLVVYPATAKIRGSSMSKLFPNARVIFFDIGYTLIDETKAWDDRFYRLYRALAQRDIHVTGEDIWHAYHDACESFEPRQWVAVVETFAKTEAMAEALLRTVDGWRHDLELPFPGATNVLKTLSQWYKLGIIANQSKGTRDRVVQRGWGEYFKVIMASAEAGISKPDPILFERALTDAKIEPQQAVMVGDRLDNDIAPAKKLGMRTIHVRQGGSGKQVPRSDEERADATVDKLADVIDLLSK
jgi:HAD superfamily hydrolase (TIGR01549 family)